MEMGDTSLACSWHLMAKLKQNSGAPKPPGLGLHLLGPLARGQAGDGCGHTVLTPRSGTLTSKNYPGTYPNHTSCEWRIQAAERSSLLLAFGDVDIESSEHCASSFLLLLSPSDGISYGPYCRNSRLMPKVLVTNSTSLTILFNSTTHRSGRGFLLSYATSQHPDLISCLDKGTHYSQQQISVYCPAGCKGIAGDIWGNTNQGYRDTSVLCKAAVHAGVILDELGGQVTLSRQKGITLYESAFANGLHSKRGSLSEKRLVFHKACDDALEAAGFNASSSWHEVTAMGQYKLWTAERAALSTSGYSWAADPSADTQWLEIDLGGRKNITGIITKGSTDTYDYYVKSYRVLSSRDGKNWKAYRSASGQEDKVFEGNANSHQEVSNTFIPPILARYVRIMPESWNQRIALKVALLGCQMARVRALRPYVHNAPKEVPVLTSVPVNYTPIPGVAMNPEKAGSLLLVMLLIGGFVLLSSSLLLLAFLCRKKRKTTADLNCGLMTGYPKSECSQVCSLGSLQPSSSELTSFPMAGTPGDLTRAPSPEYAEPDVVQVSPSSQTAPSTFKPALDEGYTLPLVMNHYDVPGKYHEYAEPLPPEPEYATPFMEQGAEAGGPAARKNACVIKVVPNTQGWVGTLTLPATSSIPSQYDSPTQRPGETLTDVTADPHKASVVYTEPQPGRTPSPGGDLPTAPHASPEGHCFQLRDSPLTHVYHEPL
ncbi:discoidin, CUB and LCCL domain-containing protein 1-like [Alligator sinensis]|uniref:Discoidin, CUB and LCCL domain-containing protein 1-like n=1 Tax=Alligator sinensis TaxID=38654 RepID=A0A3Q0GDI8_ALLSI|nr:discoidin, CUB and LCCL domain-containing protein 1-like [Alligator sinensis]